MGNHRVVRSITLMAVLVGGLVAIPTTSASAATVDPSVVASVTLTKTSDKVVPTPASVLKREHAANLKGIAAATTSTCRTISGTEQAYNYFGSLLWTYRLNGTWCWAGGKITYRYSDDYVNTSYADWSYGGLMSSSTGSTPYVRYQEVRFDHCVTIVWVTQCTYDYPWIRLTMNTNGTYSITGAQ